MAVRSAMTPEFSVGVVSSSSSSCRVMAAVTARWWPGPQWWVLTSGRGLGGDRGAGADGGRRGVVVAAVTGDEEHHGGRGQTERDPDRR